MESAPPSTANGETNTRDMEQTEARDGVQLKEETEPLTEGPTSPGLDSEPNVGTSCTSPQDGDRGGHGGNNRGETPRNNEPTVTSEEFSKEDHSGEKDSAERSPAPSPSDEEDHQVDGDEEHLGIKDINTGAREDDGRGAGKVLVLEGGKDITCNTTSPQKPCPQKQENETVEQRSDEPETLGPATEEKAVPEAAATLGGNTKYWILVGTVALLSFLAHHVFHAESPPERRDERQVDIFLRELEKVKTQFPSQQYELWRRSRIHLARHLQTAQPTEPVSLILTAGHRAERTLHCLAQGLASAFSSALNASVLHIDGASKAREDSDQVKMDIDTQLQAAFESDKPVAVIHRFEELPPSSTLIFYRYCDHENAAYKKTSLIFTVLLGGEEELPAQLGLSALEEMVDEQLKDKFLTSSHNIAFDRMDLDKYGGLWSRISHLILPVAAESGIEYRGC